MLHLIGSKEPNIKLSIDSNASDAANTIGNQACSNIIISDVNMSKQRRIKSNDTNRATFKRPNTMATLLDKSTTLTVARTLKYDKQTTNRQAIASTRVSVPNAVDDKATQCRAHTSASRSTRAIEDRHIYRYKVATT
jgi:hypothetical protein